MHHLCTTDAPPMYKRYSSKKERAEPAMTDRSVSAQPLFIHKIIMPSMPIVPSQCLLCL